MGGGSHWLAFGVHPRERNGSRLGRYGPCVRLFAELVVGHQHGYHHCHVPHGLHHPERAEQGSEGDTAKAG